MLNLLLGVAIGLAVIAAARWRASLTRLVYGVGLVVVALIYVGFVLLGGDSGSWLSVEGLGVLAYGTFGILGLRGSALWLAAGWALHPVWDIGLHLLGPGDGVVPGWYAVACLTCDLVVAIDIAVRGVPAREPAGATAAA